MLKKMLLSVFLLALFLTQAQAQLKIGKYAGEFMAIGVGGRANAMGGAYVAVANDVTAGYWNPAALARIDYPEISLMYSQNFGNLVNYNYASVALPYGDDMSFGLSIIRLGVDGIPDTRQALVNNENNVIYDIYSPDVHNLDPSRVKEFSNADWAFYFTFAKRHSDKLYYGANVKLIRRDIAEYSAMGIGFDLGLLYMPTSRLSLGANVQDITTTLVAWNTGTNELISPTAKTGIAYTFDFLYGKVTPAAGFDMRFENRRFASQMNLGPVSLDFRGGLEYSYNDVVAIRAGYNDIKDFTVGAGVRLPKLNIDYSFAHFSGSKDDALGDSHKISLTLTLESPKFLRATKPVEINY